MATQPPAERRRRSAIADSTPTQTASCDQIRFVVNDDAWQAFAAALDDAPRINARLLKLFNLKSVFE
ncbi:DUF1778 domain-containing protein [Cupriavidus sp. CuC1]|uniref:type II toxin -antitoxin system TacA 1-like antitoxin n=1 Tax=Cupriavidus sp. CuC1 TaxID=3373131 RepID=UPI0037D40E45